MTQRLLRTASRALRLIVGSAALSLTAAGLHAQSPSTPVPAMDDPRWVPSTSNPAIARIDLIGTPSAAGDFRYLLRVPEGFSLATHRHNTDLTAVLLAGEQRVVIQQPDGSTREHVLKPGDQLLIPREVPHAESWREASVVDIRGVGPMLTTTQSPSVTFPDVTGRNLEGRTLRLPADFEGERTVVLVAFRQRQQREVDSWMPELNARRAADPGLAVYEIPTLSSGWTPLRGWIDGGMARGIKSQFVREATVTLYIDKGPFKEALGIASEAAIHLLLLDREGRVTFRTTGPATPEAIAALRRALGV